MLTCPDLVHVRKLVAGDLDAVEQTALTAHLDQCPYCQEQVDRLSTGQEFARHLGRERSAAGPALRLAMAELEETSAHSAGDAVTDDDWPLDFLEPSAKPECLGRFARYDVHEVLGRGGFGVVLKAFDEELNRFVAIKVLAPPLAASSAARRRFAREARAAAAVSHEHVVAIHAVDTSGTLPYLVMQYVPGVSLQERLDADGPLGIEEILRIGYQAACGLAAAHKQGLIHRDIKPGNILLENCVERVKITDFGLARAIDDASLTQSGVLAGTPQYMAPEQAKGEALDHRTDLFSLGSVLYAMCTGGRPPFRAASTMAVLRRVCDDKPRPIRQINAAIPASFAQIIERLLEKDPARRFQSAAEVSEVLSQKLAELQQPIDLAGGVKRPSNRGRTLRRCLAAAAVVLLAVAGLAAGEQAGVTKVGEWAATILRIKTPEGTLVIEVGDPAVKVSVDGGEVTVTGAGLAELKLKPGTHKVEAVKGTAKVHDELVDIQRDGKLVVKVTLEKGAESVAAAPPAVVSKRNEAGPIYISPSDSTHVLHFTTKLSPSAVTSLAFSPDGARLVAAQQADALYILNAADGKILYRLNPPAADNTVSASFSMDGKWLISASAEGNVSRWDAASGRLQTVTRLEHPVQAIAFAPDGQTAASGGDNRLTLWEVKTGKSLRALPLKEGSLSAVAFSPDGQHLAVTGKDRVVRIWDAATGKQLSASANPSEIKALAFSADGKYLAYGREDGKIIWVSPAGGQEVRTQAVPAKVHTLRFSADGKQLASGGDDSAVHIWDVATGREMFKLQEKLAKVTQIAFSPDGKLLAWGTSDGTIRVMRVRDLAAAGPGPRSEIDHLRKQLAESLNKERLSRDEAEKQRAIAEERAYTAEAALKSAQAATDKARAAELEAREQKEQAEANARRTRDFLQQDLLRTTKEEKRLTIEARAAPWTKVFEHLSQVSDLPVNMTSKPTGTFTFVSPSGKASFTLSEYIDLINESLVTQKLLLVRQDQSFLIISPTDTIGPALIKPLKPAELDQRPKTELVSVVFPVGDLDAKSLETLVKKLLGPFGMCVARTNDKTLYVRDTAGNLRRIRDTLKNFDEAVKEKAKP
jgi:WD40 repeat protein